MGKAKSRLVIDQKCEPKDLARQWITWLEGQTGIGGRTGDVLAVMVTRILWKKANKKPLYLDGEDKKVCASMVGMKMSAFYRQMNILKEQDALVTKQRKTYVSGVFFPQEELVIKFSLQ